MASACDAPSNAPVEKGPETNKFLPLSLARSMQLEDDSQQGDIDPLASRADSVSSVESPVPNNFAQTRSPLSIDQNEQATQSRHSSGEVVEGEETGSCDSPQPRRISPFATDFMSATSTSSVFTKCKGIVPKQSVEATLDSVGLRTKSKQHSALSRKGDVATENTVHASSSEPAVDMTKSTKHEPMGEVPNLTQNVTLGRGQLATRSDVGENLEPNEHLANTDQQEVQDVTDPTILVGILTILDEDVDRQFVGEALEPDSTDSSSLTIVVTDTSEEPRPLWTPDFVEGQPESTDGSIIKNDQIPLEPSPTEVDDTKATNQQQPETKEEQLGQEQASGTLGSQCTEYASVEHDQDHHSDKATVTSSELQHAYDTTSPPHIDEYDHFCGTFTLISPDSFESAPPEVSPLNSVLNDSPNDPKQPTDRSSFSHLTPIKRTFLADFKDSSPNQTEVQEHKARGLNGKPFAERIRTERGTGGVLRGVFEPKLFSARQSRDSSIASSESGTRQDSDSQGSSSGVEEDIGPTVAPYLQHTVIDDVLQDFKADFMQQIESVIQESIKPLMPARDSAAATLLARSLTPHMETGTKASIFNARNDIMSAVELGKAEAVGCILRATEATKAHAIQIADAVQTTIIEHVDRRIDDLKKTITTNKVERTVKFETHPESTVAKLISSESLAALKQLPAVLEQAKAVAATTTHDVSKKLEQYTAKAEAVSSLCTRLDETITAKQSLQNEIVNNLCNVLSQSMLQNNAINGLAAVINPLANLVKGISYDTNLVDAKLARNAAILATITERTEALEETAERLRETVVNAEHDLVRAATKTDQVARMFASSHTTHIDRRFEVVLDQMLVMQARLDQIVGELAEHHPVSIQSTNGHSASRPRIPTEQVGGSPEPASDAMSTRVERPVSPPTSPTLFITATFEVPNQDLITLDPRAIPLSTCTHPFKLMDTCSDRWLASLNFHNIPSKITKFSFIAVWISKPNSITRRVADNDTAYQDWYDAVKSGRMNGDGSTLCFEFIGSGEWDTEEPKSKKRKQDEMRRGSEDGSGLQISFDVWNKAKQARFQGLE